MQIVKAVGAGTATGERVARWLSTLLDEGGLPKDEPVMLLLVHTAVDQAQRTLRTWRIGPDRPDGRALAAKVAEIDTEASEDAAELGGMQRYVLRAQVKGREVGSVAVRYNVQALQEQWGAVDSEPASVHGLLAQQQRYTEGLMRMFMQGYGEAMGAQQNIINTQRAMLESFHEQQAEVHSLQRKLAGGETEQALLLAQQEHDHMMETARESASLDSKGKMVESAWLYGPQLLWWLTGGKIGKSPEAMFGDHGGADGPTSGGPETSGGEPEAPPPRRRRASDDQIVGFGAALFEQLGNQEDVQPLAMPVLVGMGWESLPPPLQQVVARVAGGAARSVRGLPQLDDPGRGALLWGAILSRGPAITRVATALGKGHEWSALPKEDRHTFLQLAAIFLESLPWGTESNDGAHDRGGGDVQ
jgi:hypothetical protein